MADWDDWEEHNAAVGEALEQERLDDLDREEAIAAAMAEVEEWDG